MNPIIEPIIEWRKRMSDQFSRSAMMFGTENIEKLKNRRVAVFGMGGVGGHCVEALCRSGVGALDIFDGDSVDITNINRQIIATHRNIGRSKVDAMGERLLEINPMVKIQAWELFYLPETAAEVNMGAYDYIVDAVDTISGKLEIICRGAEAGVPVISSMGAANKTDPTAFVVADIYDTSVCPMARVMRRELRKRAIGELKVVYSKEIPIKPLQGESNPLQVESDEIAGYCQDASEEPLKREGAIGRRQTPASNAFVPPVAGLIIAGEVVKDLMFGKGANQRY